MKGPSVHEGPIKTLGQKKIHQAMSDCWKNNISYVPVHNHPIYLLFSTTWQRKIQVLVCHLSYAQKKQKSNVMTQVLLETIQCLSIEFRWSEHHPPFLIETHQLLQERSLFFLRSRKIAIKVGVKGR